VESEETVGAIGEMVRDGKVLHSGLSEAASRTTGVPGDAVPGQRFRSE